LTGKFSWHGAISLSNIVKNSFYPSTFFVETVKTGTGIVKTIKFDGLFSFEIPTLPTSHSGKIYYKTNYDKMSNFELTCVKKIYIDIMVENNYGKTNM
jgi:hypothetical protein